MHATIMSNWLKMKKRGQCETGKSFYRFAVFHSLPKQTENPCGWSVANVLIHTCKNVTYRKE